MLVLFNDLEQKKGHTMMDVHFKKGGILESLMI